MRIAQGFGSSMMWLGFLALLAALAIGLVAPQAGRIRWDALDALTVLTAPETAGQGLLPVLVPLPDPEIIQGLTAALQPSASLAGSSNGLLPLAREDWYAGAAPVSFLFPDQISIPAIGLEAPIVTATRTEFVLQGLRVQQWLAPDAFAIGYLLTSVSEGLGVAGNTVLVGHHNVFGEVFARLEDLVIGDLILVHSGGEQFTYVITLTMILPERDQVLDVRLENAQWIAATTDERLTLVTCWPYESNTHRLVIVATPVELSEPESHD